MHVIMWIDESFEISYTYTKACGQVVTMGSQHQVVTSLRPLLTCKNGEVTQNLWVTVGDYG